MWIALGIVAVLLVGLMVTYNGLVVLRQRVKNAWAQVDVQLRKRYDLVPNLVNTVKGYAKHESDVFEKVTNARAKAQGAGSTDAQAQAEGELTGTLRTLFAVAESYPELKADTNFRQLQEELSQVEDKIAFARQFYNDTVQKYNTKTQVFPTVLVASMLGFRGMEFFNIDDAPAARGPVEVKF